MVFDTEGDRFRNKRMEDHITVSVVLDVECGNANNEIVDGKGHCESSVLFLWAAPQILKKSAAFFA